jgi:hypothetical protein
MNFNSCSKRMVLLGKGRTPKSKYRLVDLGRGGGDEIGGIAFVTSGVRGEAASEGSLSGVRQVPVKLVAMV